jgi:hypothetical protein
VNPTRRVDITGGVRACGLAQYDGKAGLQVEQVAGDGRTDGLRSSVAEAVVGVGRPGVGSHPVGAIPGGGIRPVAGQVAVGVVGRAATGQLVGCIVGGVGHGRGRAVQREALLGAVAGAVKGIAVEPGGGRGSIHAGEVTSLAQAGQGVVGIAQRLGVVNRIQQVDLLEAQRVPGREPGAFGPVPQGDGVRPTPVQVDGDAAFAGCRCVTVEALPQAAVDVDIEQAMIRPGTDRQPELAPGHGRAQAVSKAGHPAPPLADPRRRGYRHRLIMMIPSGRTHLSTPKIETYVPIFSQPVLN